MQSLVWLVGCVGTAIHIYSLGAYDDDNGDNGRGGDDERKKKKQKCSPTPLNRSEILNIRPLARSEHVCGL